MEGIVMGLLTWGAIGLSIAFSGLLAVGLLTYVRRSWQLIRAEGDGSTQKRILEGIDELQTRMHLVSDRLERLERAIARGPEIPRLPDGGRGDDHPGEESAPGATRKD